MKKKKKKYVQLSECFSQRFPGGKYNKKRSTVFFQGRRFLHPAEKLKGERFLYVMQCLASVFETRLVVKEGHDSQVVKVSDRGWDVTSASPVPLKTRHVGERCTLNLSRAQHSPVGEM
ncbi:hypothetical protein TNCV_2875941 [Trichonephila clavipes]|nr:hypothetical protein TNCV_2875941 [Trichonephila clavipes]